jgi:predicted nucleotidyltransferase
MAGSPDPGDPRMAGSATSEFWSQVRKSGRLEFGVANRQVSAMPKEDRIRHASASPRVAPPALAVSGAASVLPSPGDPSLADVCSRLGLRMLVLFGSHAPGGLAPHPASDVDLAFLSARDASPLPAPLVLDRLAQLFAGREIDVVDLHGADPLFRWEVMECGLLLYGDVFDFLEFRAYAYRDYVDSADLRALERTLSDRKLQYIGERLRAAS